MYPVWLKRLARGILPGGTAGRWLVSVTTREAIERDGVTIGSSRYLEQFNK
jgi:hypothetical protein